MQADEIYGETRRGSSGPLRRSRTRQGTIVCGRQFLVNGILDDNQADVRLDVFGAGDGTRTHGPLLRATYPSSVLAIRACAPGTSDPFEFIW